MRLSDLFLAALVAASPTPAPQQTVAINQTPRQVMDGHLRRDLAYFQQAFGVPEVTDRDYRGQRRGLPVLRYTIGECHYEVIAERGRVISIGVILNERCDVDVSPEFLGASRASVVTIRGLPNRGRWEFAPRCPNTGGTCARLDDDGAVIGEPLTTYYRSSVTAEMAPQISIDGDWTVLRGRWDVQDRAHEEGTLRPLVYRESWGLF